jgi:hypothetical protein
VIVSNQAKRAESEKSGVMQARTLDHDAVAMRRSLDEAEKRIRSLTEQLNTEKSRTAAEAKHAVRASNEAQVTVKELSDEHAAAIAEATTLKAKVAELSENYRVKLVQYMSEINELQAASAMDPSQSIESKHGLSITSTSGAVQKMYNDMMTTHQQRERELQTELDSQRGLAHLTAHRNRQLSHHYRTLANHTTDLAQACGVTLPANLILDERTFAVLTEAAATKDKKKHDTRESGWRQKAEQSMVQLERLRENQLHVVEQHAVEVTNLQRELTSLRAAHAQCTTIAPAVADLQRFLEQKLLPLPEKAAEKAAAAAVAAHQAQRAASADGRHAAAAAQAAAMASVAAQTKAQAETLAKMQADVEAKALAELQAKQAAEIAAAAAAAVLPSADPLTVARARITEQDGQMITLREHLESLERDNEVLKRSKQIAMDTERSINEELDTLRETIKRHERAKTTLAASEKAALEELEILTSKAAASATAAAIANERALAANAAAAAATEKVTIASEKLATSTAALVVAEEVAEKSNQRADKLERSERTLRDRIEVLEREATEWKDKIELQSRIAIEIKSNTDATTTDIDRALMTAKTEAALASTNLAAARTTIEQLKTKIAELETTVTQTVMELATANERATAATETAAKVAAEAATATQQANAEIAAKEALLLAQQQQPTIPLTRQPTIVAEVASDAVAPTPTATNATAFIIDALENQNAELIQTVESLRRSLAEALATTAVASSPTSATTPAAGTVNVDGPPPVVPLRPPSLVSPTVVRPITPPTARRTRLDLLEKQNVDHINTIESLRKSIADTTSAADATALIVSAEMKATNERMELLQQQNTELTETVDSLRKSIATATAAAAASVTANSIATVAPGTSTGTRSRMELIEKQNNELTQTVESLRKSLNDANAAAAAAVVATTTVRPSTTTTKSVASRPSTSTLVVTRQRMEQMEKQNNELISTVEALRQSLSAIPTPPPPSTSLGTRQRVDALVKQNSDLLETVESLRKTITATPLPLPSPPLVSVAPLDTHETLSKAKEMTLTTAIHTLETKIEKLIHDRDIAHASMIAAQAAQQLAEEHASTAQRDGTAALAASQVAQQVALQRVASARQRAESQRERERDQSLSAQRHLREWQETTQRRLETERVELRMRAIAAEEQLATVQEYMQQAMTRYQKEVARLKKHLKVYSGSLINFTIYSSARKVVVLIAFVCLVLEVSC